MLDNGARCQCSCSPYALYGQCEHTVFVDSLELATRPPRINLDRLPAAARKGRKRRNEPPPRQERKRAKKKARSHTSFC